MSEENKQTTTSAPSAPKTAGTFKKPFVRAGQRPAGAGGARFGGKPGSTGGKPDGRNGRDGRPARTFADRPKPEFDQKVIDIRRVTRVVAGGRRMSFAVALAIGDGKGSVGLGTGKGADTAIAINKALKSAKKAMIKVKLTKEGSLPHEVKAKYTTSRIMIMPNHGRGLVAGSSVRDILSLAGIKNVTSKIYSGSKNKLNNGRCAIVALSQLAEKRIVREVETKDETIKE
jgi:small subunit ribosomal protein S5